VCSTPSIHLRAKEGSNFFEEADPTTGEPWTPEDLDQLVSDMRQVNQRLGKLSELSEQIDAAHAELNAALAALKEAMEPIEDARRKGLELAERLLSEGVQH
jgi:hypothetical protein